VGAVIASASDNSGREDIGQPNDYRLKAAAAGSLSVYSASQGVVVTSEVTRVL